MRRLLQSCKSSVHPPKALSAGILVAIIVSIMLIMMNEVDNKTTIIKTMMVAQLSVSLLQVMSGDPVGCYLLLLEKRNWHMSWLDPLCLCQCQYCQYRWQILHWITWGEEGKWGNLPCNRLGESLVRALRDVRARRWSVTSGQVRSDQIRFRSRWTAHPMHEPKSPTESVSSDIFRCISSQWVREWVIHSLSRLPSLRIFLIGIAHEWKSKISTQKQWLC